MIARHFGQPPHVVALWPPEWLSAAETAIAAENGAADERARRDERRRKMAGMMSGGRRA